MKRLVYIATPLIAFILLGTTTGCHFAPTQNDGDTVAASVFYPVEESVGKGKAEADSTGTLNVARHDSIGLYIIGDGSTRQQLQLLSYPSRRDTSLFYKTKHVRVKGCADIGRVVRVEFYHPKGSADSLVKSVEEVTLPLAEEP